MGALAVHHTATEDSTWDGPAAVAAMPNDAATLMYCHAWRDGSSASDKKADYKFPHHRTKGGPANLAACRNGLARLDNADIPEGDKAGVKAHLQAHMDDAKKKDIMAPAALLMYGNMSTQERVLARVPRAQHLSGKQEWFRITDNGSSARMDVFDEIGFWGVSASDFNAQLQAVNAPTIELHVNSPGGDVFDGIAILNLLRAHRSRVDVVVDGLAASAASFIAMAGDTVMMMPNSQLMIHDASGVCMGNNADMVAMADLLDRCSDNIASIYASRAGGDVADWRTAMKAETWYSADEAVTAGLADQVVAIGVGVNDAERTTFLNLWDLSLYAYESRAVSPAPVQPAPRSPDPAGLVFNPELFREAMRNAVST